MPRSRPGSFTTSGSHLRYLRQNWRRSNKRRRHHGGDDGGIEIGEAEPFQRQQRPQHHGIFVGGARRFGHGAPLAAHLLALADGEDDIGVAGVDREQASEEHLAGGDGARSWPRFVQQQRARLSSMPSNTPVPLLVAAAAPGCALPRPAARASQASRKAAKPSSVQTIIPLGEMGGERGPGPRRRWAAVAPSAAREVAGNSVSAGMMGQIDADADGQPPSASAARAPAGCPPASCPSASTSLGHLTAMAASGAKPRRHVGGGDGGGERQLRPFRCRPRRAAAARWRRDCRSALSQTRPRRPRPARLARGADPERTRSRRPRPGGAPPHWWNPVRHDAGPGRSRAARFKAAALSRPHRRR